MKAKKAGSSAADRSAVKLRGDVLPVLPLRDAVHFPRIVTTIHVAREPSIRAVRQALEGSRRILVLSQRDNNLEDLTESDLYRIGTVSEVLQMMPMPDGSMRVALRGMHRALAEDIQMVDGSFSAPITELRDEVDLDLEIEAVMRATLEIFTQVVHANKSIPPEALQSVLAAEAPGVMADAVAHHLPLRPSEKQELLELQDVGTRLESVLRFLKKEEQLLTLNSKIQQKVEAELGDAQREYYLREQLKAIQSELKERTEKEPVLDGYRAKIELTTMPAEAIQKAMREVERLDHCPDSSPESLVIRNYLDLLISMPWDRETEETIDLAAAEELLHEEHFGLQLAKERILDILAVRKLKGSSKGQVLCFAGPPGVGKTSLGRSVAKALGRNFSRIALGGVRDEAEIRGHRRTYVGAMAGRIIQSIQHCNSKNPVLVLDEIDKMGHDFTGDPVSALLEVLDAEQNTRFVDHFLETPFDLSAVLFIATANNLDKIPGPLLDRMDIIEFGSYSDDERVQIGMKYLVPKNVTDHGMDSDQLTFRRSTLEHMVRHYAQEAGVRQLDRLIATICRKAARAIAEGQVLSLDIGPALLTHYLGRPPLLRPDVNPRTEVGAITGLVVSEMGGGTICLEVSLMTPISETPTLRLTGNLGGVMRESAEAALTVVRTALPGLGVHEPFRFDTHVHVPESAIPKDGPSAGLGIALALVSAATKRPIRGSVAVTGEITLRGKILPVGGIRDKVLAAQRAGLRDVIVPYENMPEVDELAPEARSAVSVHGVKTFDEAMAIALV